MNALELEPSFYNSAKIIDKLTSDEEKNIGDSSLNYKIITDEPAENAPDFEKYSERLSNIIINSKPQFTVGIYGGGEPVRQH